MDIDLEPIPEEEPEEVEPEIEPEVEPDESEEPEEEPEYIIPFEQYMDLNFVPEYYFFDVLAEEVQNEVPAESGDINHLIEIEAEPESSDEQTVQENSDSEDEESDSEWTPSKGRRGAIENLGVEAGAAVDPRVEVRPVEDPRMEAVMRTLEQIGNLLG
ncbi:uncharacterized protein LOC130137883 [Syzygium oleosum]|uniref:uncharacterized protein LOC130137883 n=1 Tax=Syzygium oleosum TaxID=219896 RepID=UPI0024B8FDDE|nr:uncharacterized protein LOC130137883 [Syzygium oleosum]